MALICIMSAKGAPGATTTAMLLATLWPRESLLVDADPMGGDIALRMPGEQGRPLDRDGGLMRLLPLARRGLSPDTVLEASERAQGGQLVLTGLAGPEQASAVGGLWDEIGRVLADLRDIDVIVDVGQLHTASSHLPLVRRAHALLTVLRPTVPGVLHTRERMDTLRPALAGPDDVGPWTGYTVIEDVDKRRRAETAAESVGTTIDWMTDVGAIAHDPRAARMFDGIPVRRPEHTLLARSGTQVVGRLLESAPGLAAEVRGDVDDESAHEEIDPGDGTEDGPTGDDSRMSRRLKVSTRRARRERHRRKKVTS